MKFTSIIFLIIVLIGCAKYSTVEFVWTSDDHLKPANRLVVLDAKPADVAQALRNWILMSGGVEIKFDDNFAKVIRTTEMANNNYDQARQIAKKRWDSYSGNNPYEWESDFKKYQSLINSQVSEVSGDSKGFNITAKILKQTVEAKNINVTQYVTYVSEGGNLTGYAKTNALEYETVNKTLFSEVSFWIFSDQGKTKVYARAKPYDVDRDISANPGAKIKYKWWPYITGEDEAWLVTKSLKFLKSLYAEKPAEG